MMGGGERRKRIYLSNVWQEDGAPRLGGVNVPTQLCDELPITTFNDSDLQTHNTTAMMELKKNPKRDDTHSLR